MNAAEVDLSSLNCVGWAKYYMDHLRQCDQCNYDKDCVCTWAEPEDVAGRHDCNCPKGDGVGFRLIRESRRRANLQAKL